MMPSNNGVSRRGFLKTAVVMTGAAAAPAVVTASTNASAAKSATPEAGAPAVPRKKLGRTGLEVSTISIGTGGGQAPNVLQYGLKRGINYFHTSTEYAGGKAIVNLAKAIADQRDNVYLGLKITWPPENDAALDAALAKLGVDAVEIAFFNIHNANEVRDPKYQAAAERWKKAGKCRFIGLTSHKQVKECMLVALDLKFYDVLMPSYSVGQAKEFAEVFDQAAAQHVGITLMKTAHGVDAAAYEKLVPAYLALPAVATLNKTLGSFADIDRTIQSATATSSAALNAQELETMAALATVGRCAMCGACNDACPMGLAVSDMVRCSDYYLAQSGYYPMARETYAGIAREQRAGACTRCGVCENICRNAVPIRHHLRRAEVLLA